MSITPIYIDLHIDRAKRLIAIGATREAFRTLEKARQIEPENYTIMLLLAYVTLIERDINATKLLLRQYIVKVPLKNNDYMFHLAELFSLPTKNFCGFQNSSLASKFFLRFTLQTYENMLIFKSRMSMSFYNYEQYSSALRIINCILSYQNNEEHSTDNFLQNFIIIFHKLRFFNRETASTIIDDFKTLNISLPYMDDLAVLSGNNLVDQFYSNAYVASFFDGFANTYQETLKRIEYHGTKILEYCLDIIPKDDLVSQPEIKALDLGCGTGLSAKPIRCHFDYLVGVDLSPKMLRVAETTRLYNELHHCEAAEFLYRDSRRFELIVAIDVFCYTGWLNSLVKLAISSLTKTGTLIFTCEHIPDTGDNPFILQMSGRYAHNEEYLLEIIASANGYVAKSFRSILRKERNKNIYCLVVMAKRLDVSNMC